MTQKLHFKRLVVISNPDEFIRKQYDWCFRLRTAKLMERLDDDSIIADEIEFDINFNEGEIIAKVVKAIDKQLEREKEEFAARIDVLNTRRQELLALTGPE